MRILPSLLTFLLATACTVDADRGGPPAPVAPPPLGAADGFLDGIEGLDVDQPASDEQWAALSPETRREVIERSEYLQPEEWLGMKTIAFHKLESVGRPVEIDRIRYRPYREYAAGVDAYMRENVYMDIMDLDGSHSTIGDPGVHWLYFLVREEDHAVLGATIGYFQDGCDMPGFDGDVRHFETRDEAREAGCEISDVNWQAHGVFERGARPLSHYDYMEWSGY